MSLTIDLSPELESRLRAEAARHGVDLGQYVVNALRDYFRSTSSTVACLGADESRLLEEVNRGLSEKQWNRYHELIKKRRAEQLSEEEQEELVATSDRVEQLNVRRMECLADLARLRNTTLPKLMEQLGIAPPPSFDMGITAEQRKTVADRADSCCEYCKSQLKYSADSFSVEHIRPRSQGGTDDLSNLALSCQRCNNHKFTAVQSRDPLTGQTVALFHPRRHRWNEHFAWSEDYLFLRGLTPTGRATVDKLQLNREGVVNLRRILHAVGEHPPVG